MNDSRLRAALGEKGRQKVISGFAIENVVDRLLQLIMGIIFIIIPKKS